jgi:hypothetical protein
MPVDSMRVVLEGLLARLAPTLPGSSLGEILNRLVWITDDNGTDVIAVCREWLSSNDLRRIEAALSLEEGWLYDDRAELRQWLEAAASHWPQVAARVKEILETYDAQHPSST